VPAGKTVVMRTKLPPLSEDSPSVAVRYSGEKGLVILETEFE
jgi:hypothetical protein